MPINLIVAKNSLKQQETVKIFIFPAGCIIENANGRVDHLIVADEQHARVEDSFFLAACRFNTLTRHVTEMLLSQVN